MSKSLALVAAVFISSAFVQPASANLCKVFSISSETQARRSAFQKLRAFMRSRSNVVERIELSEFSNLVHNATMSLSKELHFTPSARHDPGIRREIKTLANNVAILEILAGYDHGTARIARDVIRAVEPDALIAVQLPPPQNFSSGFAKLESVTKLGEVRESGQGDASYRLQFTVDRLKFADFSREVENYGSRLGLQVSVEIHSTHLERQFTFEASGNAARLAEFVQTVEAPVLRIRKHLQR